MALAHPSLQQMRGELHVGEEFLAKYNRPGPRYTSYPTAPVWNDAFGPADLERVHQEAEHARTPVSVYMHIPFCESLCLFCACNVVIQKNKSVAPPYLDVLKLEMKRVSRSVSRLFASLVSIVSAWAFRTSMPMCKGRFTAFSLTK